jgi:hypothetical protein
MGGLATEYFWEVEAVKRKCRWLSGVEATGKKKKKITAKTPRREEKNKKRFTAKVCKDGIKDAKDGRSGDRIFLYSK